MTDKPKCLGGNMSESKEWAFGAECLAGSPDCSLDERRFLRRGRYPTLAMASPGEQTESPLKAGVAVLANRILYCACISALFALAAPLLLAEEPPRNRRAFATAMNLVREGMSEAEVLARVGKPDDVSTRKDWELMSDPTREVWRYGASGHMAAATLGQIGIDENHKVAWVTGQGAPPPDGMFTQPELRALLEALNDLPAQNGSRYNPRPVIRAVNLLQPVGKERALAAVDEFLRVSFEYADHDAREGLFLVLRTLFQVPNVPTVFPDGSTPSPPGFMPPLYGLPAPSGPDDKTLLPRFPIVIAGDVPFLITQWGGHSGPPQMPESHVAYFRKYGTLRAKPLMPSCKPFEALDAVINSRRWWLHFESDRVSRDEEQRKADARKRYEDQEQRVDLRNQLLRLLETVHRLEPDESSGFLSFGASDRRFEKVAERENNKIIAEASKRAIRWDNQNFRYAFLDGTFVPPFDPKRHPTLGWQPSVPGLNLELIFRRQSRRYVDVRAYDPSDGVKRNPDAVVRVFDVKAKDKPLFETGEGSKGWISTIRLDEGGEVRLELTVAKHTQRSPVFKP
jgi:hypothetical protein